ncbi:MAG: response regulator [Spirochaetes bacterium]|nr:response regulator [Spirochaetota bacterium]
MRMKEYYTTSDVAKILHVAVGSVINWVDDGEINAIITPGGHRKIPHKDLITFLNHHNYEIPSQLIKKRLIYIIQCETGVQHFFKDVFDNLKEFETKCFSTITDALIAIGNQTPEVIIIDANIPEIDSKFVIKSIKKNNSLEKIHIIVVSEDGTMKNQLLESGANLFLTKPLNKEVFKKAILAE